MKKIYFAYRKNDFSQFQQLQNALMAKPDFTSEYEFICRSDDPNLKESAIKKTIKATMKDISLMVVILGQEMHHSPLFEFEVDQAYKGKKPFLAIKIPKTRHQYPGKLMGYKIMEVEWDFNELMNAIKTKIG